MGEIVIQTSKCGFKFEVQGIRTQHYTVSLECTYYTINKMQADQLRHSLLQLPTPDVLQPSALPDQFS